MGRLVMSSRAVIIDARPAIVPRGISGTTNPGIVGGTDISKSSDSSDFPIMYTSISGSVEGSVTVMFTGSVVRAPPSMGSKAQ